MPKDKRKNLEIERKGIKKGREPGFIGGVGRSKGKKLRQGPGGERRPSIGNILQIPVIGG